MFIDATRSPELKTLPLRIIVALAMAFAAVLPVQAGGEPTERPGVGNPLNQAARYCLALARAILGDDPVSTVLRTDPTSSQLIKTFKLPGGKSGGTNLATWRNKTDYQTFSLVLLGPGTSGSDISGCTVTVGPDGTRIMTQKAPNPPSHVGSPNNQFGAQFIRDLQNPYNRRK